MMKNLIAILFFSFTGAAVVGMAVVMSSPLPLIFLLPLLFPHPIEQKKQSLRPRLRIRRRTGRTLRRNKK